jgi:hypothetical protein
MLTSRLLVIMQRELDSQNLQFSPYCIQQIEQLVTRGVERMRNNKAADDPGHILNAERNLRALIKYFQGYSEEAGTYPRLENADFDAALRTCPTYWLYSISG